MSLEVRLRHRYSGFDLDAEFSAPPGVTALFGPSGSGKTTIVNAIAGLLSPQAGMIRLEGETLLDTASEIDVPAWRRRVGYVFQEGRLFPHLNVRQNLTYGRWMRRGHTRNNFNRLVDLLDVASILDRRPGNLSGGEQQRIAIGRALLSEPRVLLLDEPFAALDAPRRNELLPYLKVLRDELAMPIVYVSHAREEVARLATTIVQLGSGRVVRAGRSDDFWPALSRLPDDHEDGGLHVIGHVVRQNAASGTTEVEASGARLSLPRFDAEIGQQLKLRVIVEDILLSVGSPEQISAVNILPVAVAKLERISEHLCGVLVSSALGEFQVTIGDGMRHRLGLVAGQPCHAILGRVATEL